MGAIFSVDLEDFFHALILPGDWEQWRHQAQIVPMTYMILTMLKTAHVHAIFYVLGDVVEHYPSLIKAIVADGHVLGSHGFWHRHGEREGDPSDLRTRQMLSSFTSRVSLYRAPYWDSTPRPGFCTGAFLRWLPYPILLMELKRSHLLALHPHDLDPDQPRIPGAPWWRYEGVHRARTSVLRLLQEVHWDDPR